MQGLFRGYVRFWGSRAWAAASLAALLLLGAAIVFRLTRETPPLVEQVVGISVRGHDAAPVVDVQPGLEEAPRAARRDHRQAGGVMRAET